MTDANSAAEVLEIKGLTKSLGGRNILCDINLSVNSGRGFRIPRTERLGKDDEP